MHEELPARIRELRRTRQKSWRDLGTSRSFQSRVETGDAQPSLGLLEKLADKFDVSMWRFFLPAAQWDAMLSMEEALVLEVAPFLKSLNPEQRAYILTVLEAAPKQTTWPGTGRPCGRTKQATSND